MTPKKKGRLREANLARAWMEHPLAFRFLSQLRSSDFAKYRAEQLAQGKPSNTVRLELVLISVLYKVASRQWGMKGLENPIANIALSPGSQARNRRLMRDEEQRLLAQLKASGVYFAPLAELALESAMRQRELLALSPADVDFEHRVARIRDSGNARSVPLSTRAVEIIRALPRPMSLVAPLFPLSQDAVIRTFRKACSDAGIRDLTFHDLRHEAIARICERLPMQEALRVVGYRTPAMLMRYYYSQAEDPAKGERSSLTASASPPRPPSKPELPALAAADKNMHILIVEDNRDAAQMLEKLLKLCGYSVTVAYSSREGWAAAMRSPPDVVLCDIGLPDSDGYALAEALRGDPQTARARLIAVTARSGEQDRQRSREAGFQLHLVKPVDPECLLRKLTPANV